jgi:hypothetical protein
MVAQDASTSGQAAEFQILDTNEETTITSAHMVAQEAAANG